MECEPHLHSMDSKTIKSHHRGGFSSPHPHHHHHHHNGEEIQRKKFPWDFPRPDSDYIESRILEDEYEKYERLLFRSEFKKLIEMEKFDATPFVCLMKKTMGERAPSPKENLDEGGEEEEDESGENWSTMENRSTMSSTDMEKDMLEGNSRAILSPENPFSVPQIIRIILRFLDTRSDLKTLKNLGMISKKWRDAVEDKLQYSEDSDESPIEIPISRFSQPRLKSVKNSPVDRIVPKHCHWFKLNLPPTPPVNPMTIETIFKEIGNQIRTLDLSFDSRPESELNSESEAREPENSGWKEYEKLGDYLEKYCPHLSKLKLTAEPNSKNFPPSIFSRTETLPHSLPLKTIALENFPGSSHQVNSDGGGHGQFFLPQLLTFSPSLERLHFEHENPEVILRILSLMSAAPQTHGHGHENGGRLSSVKSLCISGSQIHPDFINFALKHRWNVEDLKIGFSSVVPVSGIQNFLRHLRYSLSSLNLEVNGNDLCDSLMTRRGRPQWVIPACLNNLEHLELSPSSPKIALHFLLNALQLPCLRSIRISRNCHWGVDAFRESWNGGGKTRRSLRKGPEESCLQVFEIPAPHFCDPSIFTMEPKSPFGNLREFSCVTPTIPVIQSLFTGHLPHLERLKILKLGLTEGASDWDEIMTGLKKPGEAEMVPENLSLNPHQSPSIVKLTHLNFLQLDFKSGIPNEEKLSDFFIKNGLCQLSRLQHISINEHKFSAKAIQNLRCKVFTFCHLDFGMGENAASGWPEDDNAEVSI